MNDKTTIPIPAAFEAATKQLPYRPPDTGAFWASWLKHAQPKKVRRDVLHTLITYFPGYLEVRVFGGIGAAVCDGFVRAFVPMGLLVGEPLDLEAMKAWLDGGTGYAAEPFKLDENGG